MMQKKIINCLLNGMFILNLAACTSYHAPASSEETRLTITNKDFFVGASLARVMGSTDQRKLKDLIATAQPTQLTTWRSDTTGARFVFVSKEIFVNSQGQGCRDYEIKLIRDFFKPASLSYTACRNSEGMWQVIRH